MYINRRWTKDGAGVAGSTPRVTTAAWRDGERRRDACQAAIDAADRIINSDSISWRIRSPSCSAPTTTTRREIFVVSFIAQDGLGFGSITWRIALLPVCAAHTLERFSILAQHLPDVRRGRQAAARRS